MPYKITRISGTRSYRVINTETREVKAKKTTLKRAKAQVRLLEGLEHGTIEPRGRRISSSAPAKRITKRKSTKRSRNTATSLRGIR